MMSDVLVGVLGGMGPAATADFYRKLIAATPAGTDQDHLRVVIWADPTVPDRSAALIDDGADPRPALAAGARALHAVGATLLAVPCNTAHAFLPDAQQRHGLPVVHMIEEAVRCLQRLTPPPRQVGLLATTGTARSGLYQDWLGRSCMAALLPEPDEQTTVMEVIREVKAGRLGDDVRHRIAVVADRLVARGAEALIAGCTEIPLVLGALDVPVPFVDPGLALAEAVVRACGREPVCAGPTLSRCPSPAAAPS